MPVLEVRSGTHGAAWTRRKEMEEMFGEEAQCVSPGVLKLLEARTGGVRRSPQFKTEKDFHSAGYKPPCEPDKITKIF